MNAHFSAPSPGQKIAIIGSGISGLSAAWFLSQQHDVTLYEKNPTLGGHTNTLGIETEKGIQNVDTGFIVFNRPNYPNLTAMLSHLDVKTENTEMSFSASLDQGRLEYSGDNLNTLFAQRTNLFSPKHWKMLSEILRFNRQAKSDLQADHLELPLGNYLELHDFDDHMIQSYLLPMAAAIWSCPTSTMMKFPTSSFLQFFHNHGLLNIEDRPQWETVSGGAQRYIDAILKQTDIQIHLEDGAQQVLPTAAGKVTVISDADQIEYDHVIFASHADETYGMLPAAWLEDFAPLRHFQYQENIAYLHSDTALMPKRKLAWSSWNYLRDTKQPEKQVAVTYWMNRLQNIDNPLPILVTLNPITPPEIGKVWRKIQYHHPVFDQAAMRAQKQLKAIQGKHNLWFCGSYFGYGFHEDGLTSSVELARMWQVNLPWERRNDHLSRAAS